MKTAVVLGASGLIGSSLLHNLLESNFYSEVIVFVRKDLDFRHNKLKIHIIDFDKPDTYKSLVVGDDFFCCLGTTMSKAGTKDVFKKIDYQYPVSFARIAKDNGIQHYLIVSSVGANSKSSVFYLKTKGECEDAICKIGFQSVSIFRPASLLGNRKEYRLNEKITLSLLNILSFLLVGKLRKYKPIESTRVAEVMLGSAQKTEIGVTIIESEQMLF